MQVPCNFEGLKSLLNCWHETKIAHFEINSLSEREKFWQTSKGNFPNLTTGPDSADWVYLKRCREWILLWWLHRRYIYLALLAGSKTTVKPNETTVNTKGSHSSTLVATQTTQAANTVKSSTNQAETQTTQAASTIENAQTTQGIIASTSTAGITEATNEPLYTRSTENRPSTFSPLRNESLFGYSKLEDNESSNMAWILIPTLCFLLVALCVLMLFLYHKR